MYKTAIFFLSTMDTTKKRAAFISTPLAEVKSLSQVPGVGKVSLELLAKQEIVSPQQLMGKFMMFNRNYAAMVGWLQKTCSIRSRVAGMIAEAVFAKSERMECI